MSTTTSPDIQVFASVSFCSQKNKLLWLDLWIWLLLFGMPWQDHHTVSFSLEISDNWPLCSFGYLMQGKDPHTSTAFFISVWYFQLTKCFVFLFLRASAFTDNDIFPVRDSQSTRVVLVNVQDVQGFHLRRRAARPRDSLRLVEVLRLQVHQALQERVVVGRVKPGRTSADTDVCIEGRRLLDELEARNVSEVNSHGAATASRLLATRRFAIILSCDVMTLMWRFCCLHCVD